MTWDAVMVTGHRPQHLTDDQKRYAWTELDRLAPKMRDDHGAMRAISGMAIGADQWWATTALAAGIDLWAFVPFPQQADRWSMVDQATHRHLVLRARWTNITAEAYSIGALHQRNDQMIAAADACIAVWDPRKRTGGTASAVAKAKRARLPIIMVNLATLTTYLRHPEMGDRYDLD